MHHALRFAVLTATGFLSAGQADAALVKALVSNSGTPQLITFDTATPGTAIGLPVTVTGVTPGDTLVDIDFRPVDSALIGLGYNSTAGTARVYFIDPLTGLVSSINSNTLTLGTGLSRVMMDFNPTANAIRVTSSAATSNNLRITAAGTGTIITDTNLTPANAGIRSSAYSRNLPGGGTSGATTLYLIDGTNLINQGTIDFTGGAGGPNDGALTTVAPLSGVSGTLVGFDIFNGPGTAATSPGTAYLTTSTGSFLTLNLSTGAASSVGTIGGTYTSVLAMAVPEPGSLALGGIIVGGLILARRRKTASV